MKIVVKKEYSTVEEMDKYINDNKLVSEDYKYAVIALITDSKGNVLLQRRGNKARDGIGKLADIGGAYEEDDKTFRDAMMREIHEEVGEFAEIEIDDFVCGVLEKKYDSKTKEDINWLFLVYKCSYYGGELLDNDYGKTLEYEFYKINELPKDRLDTSKFFWDYYINGYNKCYSYVMGCNEKKIKKLDKKRFNIVEDDGDYEVIFSIEDINIWEEFIEKNLECNYWNDYIVGDEIRLIFKNDDETIDKYTLNENNYQDILIKCRVFAETQFSSVREMYENTPFYSDKLDGIVFYD